MNSGANKDRKFRAHAKAQVCMGHTFIYFWGGVIQVHTVCLLLLSFSVNSVEVVFPRTECTSENLDLMSLSFIT